MNYSNNKINYNINNSVDTTLNMTALNQNKEYVKNRRIEMDDSLSLIKLADEDCYNGNGYYSGDVYGNGKEKMLNNGNDSSKIIRDVDIMTNSSNKGSSWNNNAKSKNKNDNANNSNNNSKKTSSKYDAIDNDFTLTNIKEEKYIKQLKELGKNLDIRYEVDGVEINTTIDSKLNQNKNQNNQSNIITNKINKLNINNSIVEEENIGSNNIYNGYNNDNENYYSKKNKKIKEEDVDTDSSRNNITRMY